MSWIPSVTTCVALSAASEIVTRSIRVAAVIAALLAVVDVAPTSAENRVWRPPVQVSHVDTTTISAQVALSRDDPPRLHVVIGTQAPVDVTGDSEPPDGPLVLVCDKFSTLLDYLVVERDEPDWDAAWEDRLRYTWDSSTRLSWFSTDAHMMVDGLDQPHFIHEEHQLTNDIGYKVAGPTGWAVGNPPGFSPNAPESPIGTASGVGGVSPTLYIDESGAADSVHAIWRDVDTNLTDPPAGYWHNKKPLTGGGWGEPTLLTDVFEGCTGAPGEGGFAPAFAITSDGALHVVGRCRLTSPARAKIIHVRALWDDVNDLWATTETVIDSMLIGSGSEAEGDVSTDISVTSASLLGTEYLHASYNYDPTGNAREIRYRRYTVRELEEEEEQEDLWSAPIIVTASPGTISSTGKLFQEANGPLHLIYHEGQTRDPEEYYDAEDPIAPCEEGTVDPSEAWSCPAFVDT